MTSSANNFEISGLFSGLFIYLDQQGTPGRRLERLIHIGSRRVAKRLGGGGGFHYVEDDHIHYKCR